jgi:hypothetical protein
MHVHQHSAPRARRVKVQGHEPEMQHISRSLTTTNERTAEYCELWPTQHGGEASYGSRSDAVSGQAPRHLSCMYRGFRRHSPLAAQWRQRSACPSAASGSCLPLLAACASHVPHDAAQCLCMKIEFLPHSPLAAHSAHRVEESLQGSTTAAPGPRPQALLCHRLRQQPHVRRQILLLERTRPADGNLRAHRARPPSRPGAGRTLRMTPPRSRPHQGR